MTAQLNHTTVGSSDSGASASFLGETLGLTAPRRFRRFMVAETAKDVALDLIDTDDEMLE